MESRFRLQMPARFLAASQIGWVTKRSGWTRPESANSREVRRMEQNVRAETGVCALAVDLCTAELHREQVRRFGELFREVDLEMAQDLSAGGLPLLHRREVCVFQQFPALIEQVVERCVQREFQQARARLRGADLGCSGHFRLPSMPECASP